MPTLSEIAAQLQILISATQQNFVFVLSIVAVLWVIQAFNWLLGYRLNRFGILPRTSKGLVGIVFSPFLHGHANHLFFNSIPLFVLMSLVLLAGKMQFYQISAVIIVVSGLAVWLVARRAYHIGASSLIMGYWGYLIVNAYKNPSILTVILAIICIYYFGGLFLALIPQKREVSWEGHVFGFLAGILAAQIF